MKRITKSVCLIVSIVSLLFIVSCETSNILISEIIRSSQPRDDIKWKNITIIANSNNPKEVDASVLISKDGVHIFYQTEEDGKTVLKGSLKDPTIKNNQDTVGIFYNCYIPSTYDSTNSPIIILTSGKPSTSKTEDITATTEFYMYNLTKPSDGIKKLTTNFSITNATTGDYDSAHGIRKTSAVDSKNIFYRTVNNYYVIGKFGLDTTGAEPKINLPTPASGNYFKGPEADGGIDVAIDRIWESAKTASNGYYAVAKYVKRQTDTKVYEKYVTIDTSIPDITPTLIKKISDEDDNWHFDYFFVYKNKYDGNKQTTSIITWFGIRQDGRLYHSHSTDSELECSDSYSYSRYAPMASLNTKFEDPDTNDTKNRLVLFSRNSSNGFLVADFNKIPNGESIRNSYETVTDNFAENLRSEDISDFGFFDAATDGSGKSVTLIVLSDEVGVSTYQFDSDLKPSTIKNTGKEIRDEVALPYKSITISANN